MERSTEVSSISFAINLAEVVKNELAELDKELCRNQFSDSATFS